MIRLEIGLKLRHGGVMRVCAIEDKTAVVVLHRIAVLQEISFVSRPWVETLSDRTPPPRGRGDLDELKSLSPGNGHGWLITFCF